MCSDWYAPNVPWYIWTNWLPELPAKVTCLSWEDRLLTSSGDARLCLHDNLIPWTIVQDLMKSTQGCIRKAMITTPY